MYSAELYGLAMMGYGPKTRQDQQLFFIKRNCLLKTLSSFVYWMGPVYLVIFCYWVGPVPYLELFGAGPVEKNTLYMPICTKFPKESN